MELVADPRKRIVIEPAVVGPGAMYHLMNAAIAPRPVAWVSTLAPNGTPNLAPHSYTTIFSTDPPIVGFVSVGRKDSLNNCEATGEFVLNIASQPLLEQLNTTAADFPPAEDEFGWANLSRVACDVIAAPRVGEAPISFETRVVTTQPVGNCFLILGEVLRVHIASDIWHNGRIDPLRLDPILRLAGSGFGRLGETFNLRRPTWQDIQNRTANREESS